MVEKIYALNKIKRIRTLIYIYITSKQLAPFTFKMKLTKSN